MQNKTIRLIDVSIVVPVYKSVDTLPKLNSRISESLKNTGIEYEVIYVEDCGGDNSWDCIETLSISDFRVRGIQLSRNFGQHAATICGIAQANGGWIVTIDDDLESRPEDIILLLDEASKGHDIVYGIFEQRRHAVWRNLSSSLVRWLFVKIIPSLNYEYTSFRVIRREIAKELVKFESPFPFIDGYLSWLSNRCSSVVVSHNYRLHGRSNYSFRKLIVHAMNIVVSFSDIPLRIASYVGFLSFLAGFGWMLFILLRYLFVGISVSGFASLMIATLFFSGTQLLMLGVFGEYLGRINFKTSKKPLYLIRHSTEVGRE
jgi:glycosyltransferase involved in cell wall biosynthesis